MSEKDLPEGIERVVDAILANEEEYSGFAFELAEWVKENWNRRPTAPPAELPESPLSGHWRYSHGHLFCGTLRVTRWDIDTSPSEEFKEALGRWMAEALNGKAVVVPESVDAKWLMHTADYWRHKGNEEGAVKWRQGLELLHARAVATLEGKGWIRPMDSRPEVEVPDSVRRDAVAKECRGECLAWRGCDTAEMYTWQSLPEHHKDRWLKLADRILAIAHPAPAVGMEVCRALDEFQREYEANTRQPGRMPGNDLYSGKLMAIVAAARAASLPSQPGAQGGLTKAAEVALDKITGAIRYLDRAFLQTENQFAKNNIKGAIDLIESVGDAIAGPPPPEAPQVEKCGAEDPKRRAWCVLPKGHAGRHQDSWEKKFTAPTEATQEGKGEK